MPTHNLKSPPLGLHDHFQYSYTPLKINIAPERDHPKRKLLFQPSIFRCENVSFREGKLRENQQNWLQLHHVNVDLILSTSPVFIDCSLYQHSMIGDIKGLHILFVLFMECQMWTLMVTVILMSYFFVVAPFVELQFTANGLQCLSIHSFSEYLGWRSKEKLQDFLPVLLLFLLLCPLFC